MQPSRVVVCLAFLVAPAGERLEAKPAAQRGGADRADERREDRAVRDAQEDLEDARKAVREAERTAEETGRNHRAAVATRQAAAVAVQKKTDALAEEHAGPTGLTAARARWKQLTEHPSGVPPEELAEQKREARAHITAAEHARDEAVTRDPALKKAREAFERARAAEMQAEATSSRAAAALATARTRFTRSQQALAAKKAADQGDTNKARRTPQGTGGDRTK